MKHKHSIAEIIIVSPPLNVIERTCSKSEGLNLRINMKHRSLKDLQVLFSVSWHKGLENTCTVQVLFPTEQLRKLRLMITIPNQHSPYSDGDISEFTQFFVIRCFWLTARDVPDFKVPGPLHTQTQWNPAAAPLELTLEQLSLSPVDTQVKVRTELSVLKENPTANPNV